MRQNQERDYAEEHEDINSQLDDIAIDAAGLDGKPVYTNADQSLSREISDYDEDSGAGGASGIGDDPHLEGATGVADDVGMHIEPGFSIGYDDTSIPGIDGDVGNEVQGGGYLSLADAADGYDTSLSDDGTHVENALGVPDEYQIYRDGNYSIESVSGRAGGYGAEGTDTDNDMDESDS